ncbi:hypothetical protein [Cohnella hongkongensis]|uniref:DUF4944 domain-containing protein n=1 Tax=Cohnella hongkongensis TaxID=178337 RepID=A0ABV9F7Q5_9BACL
MKRIPYKVFSLLAIFVLLICLFVFYLGKPDRISNKFAGNLFDYPLPKETTLIEKKQYNGRNWVDSGGSGGFWNVVAFMKLHTNLPKSEIVKYYKAAGKFPYPDSKQQEVQVEIYFEDDRKLVEEREGAYYLTKGGSHQTVDNMDVNEQVGLSNEVIIQIVSGFKYFQID